jgi:hypothetical protein
VLIAAVLVCHGAAAPFDFRGKVIAIADGDTISNSSRGQATSRNSPKRHRRAESGQAFGQSRNAVCRISFSEKRFRSSEANSIDTGGTSGPLSSMELTPKPRTAASRDGVGVRGLHHRRAGRERPIYQQAEAEARAAKRGLWGHGRCVAPWDFRRPRSEAVSAAVMTNGRIIGNLNSKIYHLPNCPDYTKVG